MNLIKKAFHTTSKINKSNKERNALMEIKKVWEIYFSPTGTTKKVVTLLAEETAAALGAPLEEYNFTLPKARQSFPQVTSGDLVIFGMPTYAGRLPNLMLKYLNTIAGNGALAVPVVTFGNRAFDNSLIELRNILEGHGFHTVAAGASQKSFQQAKQSSLQLHPLRWTATRMQDIISLGTGKAIL